jgi:hypothetical protein
LDHAEKRIIRLGNLPFEVPHEDPDDVGVDQAPDPGFPVAQDGFRLLAGRHVAGELIIGLTEIAMGDVQVTGQLVEGCDDALQLVLVPGGRRCKRSCNGRSLMR